MVTVTVTAEDLADVVENLCVLILAEPLAGAVRVIMCFVRARALVHGGIPCTGNLQSPTSQAAAMRAVYFSASMSFVRFPF